MCISLIKKITVITSPEHEVLIVSYCGSGCLSSVVVRRLSCVVRQHLIDDCDPIFMKLRQNACFDNI